jgi:outer membrane lipoprotein-sorting protein
MQKHFAILLLAAGAFGCRVSRTTHIAKTAVPPPPRVASVNDLIARINRQSAAVHTLSATVNLEPTTGSIYSGVIKQYHDVRGYILFRKPDSIRVIGQAPVVRTDIFDMASTGPQFRLYVPSQNKFYVGSSSVTPNAKNSLEKLRPEHIEDALFLQPVNPLKETYFREDVDGDAHRDYVIGVLASSKPGQVNLQRKIWFDRSDLQIFRVQFYGPGGAYLEEVRYSNYEDFGGVRYPGRITVSRPEEGYSLAIAILKAVFNQPIPSSKFSLHKPQNAQLVKLGSGQSQGGPRDR